MSDETRETIARLLHKTITFVIYGGSVLGAVVASYDHLVVWFRDWSTQRLAPLSAGMVEFALVSGLYGLKVTEVGRAGRRWIQGLVLLGVVSAAYANLSWALRSKHGVQHVSLDALDTILGSVLLPVFSLVSVHAWAVVWSAREGKPSRGRASRKTKRAKVEAMSKTNRETSKTRPRRCWPMCGTPAHATGRTSGMQRASRAPGYMRVARRMD